MDQFEALYRAVESRDARWDGRVFVGVTSTGIFCRPICPVPMPRREHVQFYRSAAAAAHAGFRACRRCRPEDSPDSPDWDVRGDVVGRALRLIGAGVADDEGIGGLADRLAVSTRHLHRSFVDELGVGPHEVARTRRAGLAKQLLEQTDLTSTEVAFAAGFRSLRAYNEAVRGTFGRSPTEIRDRRRPRGAGPSVSLRLAYRRPLAIDDLLTFVGARAIPGVEAVDGGRYRRAVRGPYGPRLVVLEPLRDEAIVRLTLPAPPPDDLAALVRRSRRLLDLDADPATIDAALAAAEPLRGLVAARPGVRLPGAFDGWETTVLAILAQGVSLASARVAAGRLAEALGDPVDVGDPSIRRLFPPAAVVAAADLSGFGIPVRKSDTVRAVARAVADGLVGLEHSDPADTVRVLRAIPGIGPWTAGYVALRVLRDPDAELPGDAAVRAALRRLGMPADDGAARRLAETWRPWRGYGYVRLWSLVA
ncbi:MAG TPA: AlkA N-terminal domain-containing protein [Candidatus Limnocylindrales bacterium]|nr:AlkA N-terminal domain-containing protein [Candidatus Limnocylindrales bacterium]